MDFNSVAVFSMVSIVEEISYFLKVNFFHLSKPEEFSHYVWCYFFFRKSLTETIIPSERIFIKSNECFSKQFTQIRLPNRQCLLNFTFWNYDRFLFDWKKSNSLRDYLHLNLIECVFFNVYVTISKENQLKISSVECFCAWNASI